MKNISKSKQTFQLTSACSTQTHGLLSVFVAKSFCGSLEALKPMATTQKILRDTVDELELSDNSFSRVRRKAPCQQVPSQLFPIYMQQSGWANVYALWAEHQDTWIPSTDEVGVGDGLCNSLDDSCSGNNFPLSSLLLHRHFHGWQ